MGNSKHFSWFKFDVIDWLTSQEVACLSLEEQGAYIRALCHIWESGSVPGDPEKLAKVIGSGCSVECAAIVKQLLTNCQADISKMTHWKLEELREGKKILSNKRSQVGSKGGKTRIKTGVYNVSDLPTKSQAIGKQLPSDIEIRDITITPNVVIVEREISAREPDFLGEPKKNEEHPPDCASPPSNIQPGVWVAGRLFDGLPSVFMMQHCRAFVESTHMNLFPDIRVQIGLENFDKIATHQTYNNEKHIKDAYRKSLEIFKQKKSNENNGLHSHNKSSGGQPEKIGRATKDQLADIAQFARELDEANRDGATNS